MTDQLTVNFKMPEPPRGIKAIPWRLPIWLYRLKLGWLMGHRALLLTHTGRKSGQPRTAMLEVVHYDPETNTHYVASGFGEKSQWYQNIMKTPEVTIQVGNKKIPAVAERLTQVEAEKIFEIYERNHPYAIKNLSKLIGYQMGDREEDMQAFRQAIPIIAFHPTT
ncbi:MAG: nitroreductase family deazaflavin-dependent oxidoreductase [Anaerolineales bacterium]